MICPLSRFACRFTRDAASTVALGLVLLATEPAPAADEVPAGPTDVQLAWEREHGATHDQRMQWWREARFGMFIHWGVYAVPAGMWNGGKVTQSGAEWIMNRGRIPVADYRKFAGQFNPVKFNADEWVRLAKQAGMKYIVITAKHHDGFAMYHSKASPFNIYDATPFKRDPLKELAAACRKEGIKLGFYYSQAQDWNHPGGAAASSRTGQPTVDKQNHWDVAQQGSMDEYIDRVAIPQVKELLGGEYGEVAVLWWDTPVGMNTERALKFLPLLKLQPQIISNNRLDSKKSSGDFFTPEQKIPDTGIPGQDWETCMTMNRTWGFRSYDDDWKSAETLIRNLVNIASKGGNYLLNVGPTAEGAFPDESVKLLKQIGDWMKVNGESIYGTTANPLAAAPEWGKVTRKGNTLYLHVFDWPDNGKLEVSGLDMTARNCYLLADEEKQSLTMHQTSERLSISLPSEPLDVIDTVVVLEISGGHAMK